MALRAILARIAASGQIVTYRDLARRAGFAPPHVISQAGRALEDLMVEDARAGRPLLSSLCVSRAGESLPRPGFFLKAVELGLFDGPPEGDAARAFHAREMARTREYYQRASHARSG